MELFVREKDIGYRAANREEILKASRIIAAKGLSQGKVISDSEDAIAYIEVQLQGKEQEEFWVLYLNAQHKIISWECMFVGSLIKCQVYPRELFKRALALNCQSLILAHNHPSGAITASQGDRDLTKTLQEVAKMLDIAILDHIVVGEEPISFKKLGIL